MSWRSPSKVCAASGEWRVDSPTLDWFLLPDFWVRVAVGSMWGRVWRRLLLWQALFLQFQSFLGCLQNCFAVKRGFASWDGGIGRQMGLPGARIGSLASGAALQLVIFWARRSLLSNLTSFVLPLYTLVNL